MAEMRLTPQQQAVVENRGGTLLVSAAAGSGKTKVLVDRVLKKIRYEGKNINEFLIITFTNAAAAELRGKISAALMQSLGEEPGNRHLERQQNLLQLAQISTVHAFCGNLIREFGYRLEIPGDYSMLEDPQREEILDRLLEDLLEEWYDKMPPGFSLLVDTLGAGRNDSGLMEIVKALFETLQSQPDKTRWLHSQRVFMEETVSPQGHIWSKTLLHYGETQIRRLVERYDWAISRMRGDEKLTPKYLPAFETQRAALEKMLDAFSGAWDEISGKLTMDYPTIRVVKYEDQSLLNAIKAVRNDGKELLSTLRTMFGQPWARIVADQNYMAPGLSALLTLVEELDKRFSREKRRKNLLDFSDQEHLAIRLLVGADGSPTEIAQEVSTRFTEIMVDEYQDSNRIQELIFTAISTASDDNRFLVGDVKQSIYGFRQAEPELFLEKYHTYTDAAQVGGNSPRKLVLSHNFRSRPEILEAVNHVFASVMSPQVGGLHYGAAEALYPGLGNGYPQDEACHVELDVLSLSRLPAGDATESAKYRREAAFVANRIGEILKAGIPVRDGDSLRPVRPEDIAILFRAKSAMYLYQRALREAGIPIASGGGENLFDFPEVQVLVNFLRVLHNPHQDIPMLSVLCSPMFRVSNDQLAKIRNGSREKRFYDAMAELQEPWCQEIVSQLSELRRQANAMSAEQLVWYLLYDRGLINAYCAMEQGSEGKKHLLTVYELARKASGGNYLYLYELIRYLDRQIAAGYELPGEGSTGVTLTTIHKSKGLEYPVVFLCDLSRSFNFRELSGHILTDSRLGLGTKIVDPQKRIRYPGLAYQALQVVRREALLSEEMRILYVDMTRPKDYLFMVYAGTASKDGNKFLSKLVPGVGKPAALWATADAGCMGDWLLLSALGRVEAGELFQEVGRPNTALTVSQYPWKICLHAIEDISVKPVYSVSAGEKKPVSLPIPERIRDAISYHYPFTAATKAPSKLTATQLKGRHKDTEAAEGTAEAVHVPQMTRPEFIIKKQGLSAAERGTCAHLFLQYASYHQLDTEDGVIAELDRLVDDGFILEEQAEAVDAAKIAGLFRSPLGRRLQNAETLIREYKFSILTDAESYYPGVGDEKVLLQGVIDAAILEPDGLSVIDFKTDRVLGNAIRERAEAYRPQLVTYKQALERIFRRPVKEMILYFLHPGEEVLL